MKPKERKKDMPLEELTLKPKGKMTFSVKGGIEVTVTIADGRSFVCEVLNVRGSEDNQKEDSPTTKEMLTFLALNDRELNEEPRGLYKASDVKDKL